MFGASRGKSRAMREQPPAGIRFGVERATDDEEARARGERAALRGYKVFCVSGQASERINDYGHN